MFVKLHVHVCIWNSKYIVHVYKIQTNADFIFQKLIVFVTLVDFIVKISLKNTQAYTP